MANKNDLRFIKTEDLICDTFRSLCINNKKIPTVAALCTKAQINKSTFYMHYDCMEALRKKIGKDTVHAMMKKIPELNGLFTDVDAFVYSLINIFDYHATEVRLFFNSSEELVDVIEQEILDIYIQPGINSRLSLKVRFCVGGALRLLSNSLDRETMSETIDLIRKSLK